MNFMAKPVDNRKLVDLIKESRAAAPDGKEEGKKLFGTSLNRPPMQRRSTRKGWGSSRSIALTTLITAYPKSLRIAMTLCLDRGRLSRGDPSAAA